MAAEGRNSPYTIVFDGGSRGNPGQGYGSFQVRHMDAKLVTQRLNFDHISTQMTNNQAEYRSLIAALSWVLNEVGPDARSTTVSINGDSMLVIQQLKGVWKVKNDGLRPLWETARELIGNFGTVELRWHDRSNSVRILGH